MRSFRGLLAGLAAMVGIVSLVLVPLFFALGPERALVGHTLEFNNLWIGLAMVASLVAACVGGWIAHRVSQSMTVVLCLAATVLVAGLAEAGYHHWLMPAGGLVREALPWPQFLLNLHEPLWYDLALPVLMALFVWVAGSSRAVEEQAGLPATKPPQTRS